MYIYIFIYIYIHIHIYIYIYIYINIYRSCAIIAEDDPALLLSLLRTVQHTRGDVNLKDKGEVGGGRGTMTGGGMGPVLPPHMSPRVTATGGNPALAESIDMNSTGEIIDLDRIVGSTNVAGKSENGFQESQTLLRNEWGWALSEGDFSRDIRSLLAQHCRSLDMSRVQRTALTLMASLRLFSGEAIFNEEGAEGMYLYIYIFMYIYIYLYIYIYIYVKYI
jgi:hypothetical protein